MPKAESQKSLQSKNGLKRNGALNLAKKEQIDIKAKKLLVKATGERYLPKRARAALTAKEYAATSAKKRADTKKGKQHSSQPDKIAKKTAKHRSK